MSLRDSIQASLLGESAVSDQYNKKYSNRADKALSKYVMNGSDIWGLPSVWDDLMNMYANQEELVLYRGMNFDTSDEYAKFISGVTEGSLVTHSISSWSPSKSVAEQFSRSKPSYMEFMTSDKWEMISQQEKEREGITGYRGVLLQTTIKEGTAVDVSLFEGHAESEVLLPPGTYRVEVEEVLTYKDRVASSDINSILLSLSREDLDGDKHKSIFPYLDSHHKPEDFSKEARDHIYKLTIPPKVESKVYKGRWERDEIEVYVGTVSPIFLRYYDSSQLRKYYSLLRPELLKVIKQVRDLYEPHYKIEWVGVDGKTFSAAGLYREYIQLLRDTVGKSYNSLDARDINKLSGKERDAAMSDYMEKIKKAISSIK